MGTMARFVAIVAIVVAGACRVPNAERTLPPNCGNGIIDPGEVCDDGNNVDGDGCAGKCRIESCGNRSTDDDVEGDDGNTDGHDACISCRNARCGGGYWWFGPEQCDDGNTNNNDGCLNNCTTARCGDFVVWTG